MLPEDVSNLKANVTGDLVEGFADDYVFSSHKNKVLLLLFSKSTNCLE